MFNLIEGPIDEHKYAVFQYIPFAPDGLFLSTERTTAMKFAIRSSSGKSTFPKGM
jgi:hypothetical protein